MPTGLFTFALPILVSTILVSTIHATDAAHQTSSCGNAVPASQTYGINLHNHFPTDAALNQMREAGLTTFRVDGFDWKVMEVKPNTYDLSGYDKVIPRFQAKGLRIVTGIGHDPPSWYNGSIYTEQTQIGLANMYAALSSKYSNVMWEFTNEPNNNPLWSNNASGFTVLANRLCDAIHAGSSTNTCVGPSSAFISRKFRDFDWLQQTFEAGLLDHIDALLVHPYRADAPETAIPDFQTLRQLVLSYAPFNKNIDIFNGEWGYASGSGSSPLVTLKEQGILAARVFLVSHLVSDGFSIWYEWVDGGTTPSGELMGLVLDDFDPNRKTDPFTPKPSYNATKALARITKGTSFVGRIPTFQDGATTADEYVLKFENKTTGRIVLAAWSLAGFPHITRLSGGRGCFDVFDLYGNNLNIVCEDPRGIHLNLTQSPIYLISK